MKYPVHFPALLCRQRQAARQHYRNPAKRVLSNTLELFIALAVNSLEL